MTTVAQGQIRDQMKAYTAEQLTEVLGCEQPEQRRRRLTGQAAELLRMGAPGRALEVLEALLLEFERADQTASPAQPAQPSPAEYLACGCPVVARSLCPHGNSDLA